MVLLTPFVISPNLPLVSKLHLMRMMNVEIWMKDGFEKKRRIDYVIIRRYHSLFNRISDQ